MQLDFGFGPTADVAAIRRLLDTRFGMPGLITRREPIGQLIKSLISSRTRDAVSLEAYDRLVAAIPDWTAVASAPVIEIQSLIRGVTYAEVKAPNLIAALRAVIACRGNTNLGFLRRKRIMPALRWLETLPGVGSKVSASTLNFSTLAMPAFVIDTHILRILRRLGMVGVKADTDAAYEMVTAMTEGWSAIALAELHIQMKRLGQMICRADHAECGTCPLCRDCVTALGHRR